MTGELVAGVDIGTGAVRAVAIDRSGEVRASSELPLPAQDLPRGESNPDLWKEGLIKVLEQLKVGPPVALGIGGHGPTTVLPSSGRALTYQHPAGASADYDGQHRAQAQELSARSGGGNNQPRRLWDYLASQLGGSPHTQAVWPGLDPLEGFGDPIPVGSSCGVTAGGYVLPDGIILAPGANDAFLTAWASSIDIPGKGFDPGGRTGGLGVAISSAEHPVEARRGMPGHVAGIAVVGGPVAAHGAMLEWWSRVTGREVGELIGSASRVRPGSEGVMILPYLEGERAPRWEPDLRAEIHGLSSDAGPEVIARALLEASAYGLAHIAQDLADRGITMNRMVSSGAPSQSELWVRIKAAVLGIPVDVPECHHMAAYGAALAAGAAAGWWPRPGEGSPGDWPTPAVTTYPPERVTAYEEGLSRFIALGDQAVRRIRQET
ncbi:MAG: FGGY-family carbohydrate kinase [bacterium]|nr:FGGY-family carbohydrate kinase [bacterium]